MEVQGKYNKAKIFTENVDSITIGQIINLCNQKEFKESSIRIMPDCHAGKGCTIGTTMTISDKVVPNLVGVDIGCGMATIPLEKYINNINYTKLDKIIRDYIPHGFKIHNKSREKLLKNLFNIDINNLKCEVNKNRAYMSLGTLGGGNHFIEVDKSEKGQMYLTVHTGSRNLGKQIADYYQDKAIKYCVEKYKKSYDDAKEFLISTLKKTIKNI
ncbi:RtcB family protein [Clostridioides sp. ES-S-0108-01]|uniref:RtcB family protein n=1 Tax=Clostridioides sp. ES-S-0108-01 TaxID=2770773 RepID=UPI0039BCCC2D